MTTKIRVGIIGTGFGAKVHAPIFQSHPGFEVVSIASVARGRIEEIQSETGLSKVYQNWQDMLSTEQLDLVVVASAPYLHHEMVLAAFNHNCHVLCEKPMAFNLKEAEEMIEARDQAEKLGFINFEFRNLPARQKIKEIIASGQLGHLYHIQYTVGYPSLERLLTSNRGWLGQEDKGGGMLGAIGSHMFDSLLWWTGEKLSTVSGLLTTNVAEIIDHNGVKEARTADDSFNVIGSLTNGATFNVSLTSASRHSRGWQLEVFGSQGTLVMTDDKKVLLGKGNSALEEIELVPDLGIPEGMAEIPARYYNALYRQFDHLYTAITSGSIHQNIATFEHGVHVQNILDSIRASSAQGKRIEITNSKHVIQGPLIGPFLVELHRLITHKHSDY